MADVNKLFSLGHQAFKNKDYVLASKYFQEILEIDENNHKTWNAYGVVNSKLGNYENAQICYENALTICPNNENYQKNLKTLLEKMRIPKVKKIQPEPHSSSDNSSILQTLKNVFTIIFAIFILFIAYTAIGQEITNKAVSGKDVDIISSDEAYRISTQAHKSYDEGRYSDAIIQFKKALELEPDSYSFWNMVGISQNKLKNYEEALISFDNSLKINPKINTTWVNKANALYNLGIYEEAINALDKAISINSNDSDAWYMKAASLNKLDRYGEASKAIDRCLVLNINDADAWNEKGIILQNLKQYDAAITAYDKAIALGDTELAPNNKRNLEKWINN